MHGKLYHYFEADHKRLEALLNRATQKPGEFELTAYGEFRSGLLRHIGLEEKILFPAAQNAKRAESIPGLQKLRLDHGALTALMAPPPTAAIVTAIRAILVEHDALEESPGGPYDVCERLAGNDVDQLLEKVSNAPAVPVLPHRGEAFVLEATRRAVARAGYDLAKFEADDNKHQVRRGVRLDDLSPEEKGTMSIKVKRVYEQAEHVDGVRILVDRLWPRGLTKDDAALDEWIRDIAPSNRLRAWFGRMPDRWLEFQRRYREKLKTAERKEVLSRLKKIAGIATVTLLYAAKDVEHNNAVALAALLQKKGK